MRGECLEVIFDGQRPPRALADAQQRVEILERPRDRHRGGPLRRAAAALQRRGSVGARHRVERFDAGSTVDEQALRSVRLVQGKVDRIKILGHGELTKKLTVTAHQFSASAREKIASAGGKIVELVSAVEGEASTGAKAES